MAVIGLDGAFIRRARAELIARDDLAGAALARRLSDQTDGWFDALGNELPPGWALIATGGYANRLLCPGSDIDVVLIHPGRASQDAVRAVAEPLWYPMWDAGVKLSPAVHSVSSLLSLAASDLPTATSVLRIRRLAGDEGDIEELRRRARQQWQKRASGSLSLLRTTSAERWERAGEVASLLEPDLKDGRGGLRDHDALRWALAVDRPEITEALEGPLEDLAPHAETLLAVRCELHRSSGKATNVLLLQDQDEVAEAMGYADADVLMSRVSAAARAIDWASERFWWRVERELRRRRPASARRVTETLLPGVTVVDDEVEVDIGAAGDDQSLVFRVAAAAAHAGYPISRRALLSLSGTAALKGEPWDERTKQALVALLGAGASLVGAVEALEHYELFSRMLPEWRHVRSRPQRNAFHIYTVDRHLLQTVANATELVRDVARPDLLLVGALLHDIGKGYPGDHTLAGMRLVDDIVPRMGFSDADVDVVRSLVEHHLLLAETALRRDLNDPRTAENVAALVREPLRLELLDALTRADSRATGPSAWSSWKASLIGDLVASVSALLGGQRHEPPTVLSEERFSDLLVAVRGDARLHSRHENSRNFDRLLVATPDHRGVFAQIAGTLALHGVDVVGASAWTSVDGIAVDEFEVYRSDTVSSGTAPVDWLRVEHDLRAAVEGALDIGSRLAQRIRTYSRSHRRPIAAAPPMLEVLVSNDASASTTMIDVRAPDAMAVLYRLASTLADLGLDIRSAKVATLGHEVVDVFYVQRSGRSGASAQVPIGDHEALRVAVKSALTSGGGTGAKGGPRV